MKCPYCGDHLPNPPVSDAVAGNHPKTDLSALYQHLNNCLVHDIDNGLSYE
jgi:hypothetical protein